MANESPPIDLERESLRRTDYIQFDWRCRLPLLWRAPDPTLGVEMKALQDQNATQMTAPRYDCSMDAGGSSFARKGIRAGLWAAAGLLLLLGLLHSQPTAFERLAGRDLWKQKPSEADLAQLTRLVGDVPKGFITEPVPWHLWRLDVQGRTRYLVLLGEDLMMIPGGTSACVQLYDTASTRMHSWSFQTGWRSKFVDAELLHSAEVGSELLVFRMARAINGRDIAKEYFALGGDRLRLVRLESSIGKVIQNEYILPNFEIGLTPDASTVDEWLALLKSPDPADVLSALTFLGGRHIVEPERRFVPEPQRSKYAELFERLLGDDRIREAIDHLRNSENPWIAETAPLAARGPRDRHFD